MLDGKVIITQTIHPAGMELLKQNVKEVVVSPSPDEGTLLSVMDDRVTGIVVRHNRLTKSILDKAVNLKVIARHGVGVELIDVAAATARGIPVVNTPMAAVTSVAEHTIMMMLCLTKKLFYADKEFRAGGYDFKNTYKPDDLEGAVLGIIGFGNIGRCVARRAAAFDMEILAYDPYVPEEAFAEAGVRRVSSLEELLPASDFVTIHTPLTDITRHLLGKKQFAMMKPSAYFINCARGEVVVETELIEALQNGVIQGAGLEVFDPEPPRKDNPLFKMDNVILTPHSSALTTLGSKKMSIQSAQQLLRVLSGEGPEHLVNKEILNAAAKA